ncbi:DNA-binding XRE family transcriptional regulator [Nocardia sp. GAS34]|uniref:helix-turn-helix domain-containing protein n=1 Tax=unclassified Nocardia TaxID=2637762 RepID=UPI003D1D570A
MKPMEHYTLVGRALGRRITQYRTRIGMTKQTTAAIVQTSPQTFWRLENGVKVRVSDLWIHAWSDAFECTDDERKELLDLAAEMRPIPKGWWFAYPDAIPPGFERYLALEASATRLTLCTSLIPDLLQTPDYQRALLRTENPSQTLAQVDRQVEVTAARQRLLADQDFTLEVYLSEMAQCALVGNDDLTAEQLLRLLELMKLPNVIIRIMPFQAATPLGPHTGTLALLDFPRLLAAEHIEPPLVYIKGLTGDRYLEQDDHVASYQDAIRRIRQTALSTAQTRELLSAARRKRAPGGVA